MMRNATCRWFTGATVLMSLALIGAWLRGLEAAGQDAAAAGVSPVNMSPVNTGEAETQEEQAAENPSAVGGLAGTDAADAGTEAAASADTTTGPKPPPEGHSYHGEVFNEGPRQAARLIDGVGIVRFPVTTANEEARRFVEQGVAQLHGFWYFESERSFRQAAMLDPNCPIAYWGMAMSNRNNEKRAKGFISEAMSRREQSSPQERMWIEALDRYLSAKSASDEEKQQRSERYVSDLEEILLEFPDDLELKAFLCEFLWSEGRKSLKVDSYLSVDALIRQILDVEPLHPAHHYRIHLWDLKKPEKALESAARCGLAAPAIAHMWHMPGHIYSRVRRYHDAVYQQEASARVDHAQMMRDRLLPDQIHNFAHNNEWCIRNLVHIGRINDAILLAKNMIEMPRHPRYNHIDRFGSYKYGRQRLLEVLTACELFEDLIALSATSWLDETGDADEDLARNRAVGAAAAATGRTDLTTQIRQQLQTALETEKGRQKQAGDDAEQKARDEKQDDSQIAKARTAAEEKPLSRVTSMQKAIDEIDGRLAAHAGQFDQAVELLEKAGGVRTEQRVALLLRSGRTEDAVKKIDDYAADNRGEVLPLACRTETLWAAGQRDRAREAFEELRRISSQIDTEIPPFARLQPIAVELGFGADWKLAAVDPGDLGPRPDPDTLGPFRWQPQLAVPWTLPDMNQQSRSLSDYRGRPVVVIFYLGYGCLHCAEQLQKFAPRYPEFQAAGLEIVAVSTDRQENLKRALADYEPGLPFPLVADPEQAVFRAWRCFDDFEKTPLHGTFLIDAAGRVRWHDISFEPFMDAEFVLKEAQRLFSFDQPATGVVPADRRFRTGVATNAVEEDHRGSTATGATAGRQQQK